jgi:hypothetical protein
MKDQSPARADQLIAQHVSGKQRRDWGALTKVVNVWSRRREIADASKMKEVSKRKFYMKHRQLGYTEPQVERKWEKATSAERFRQGLARRVGKKVYTFMPKSREMSSTDIIALSLEGERETSYMTASTAKSMLQGKQQVQLSDGTRKTAFGG